MEYPFEGRLRASPNKAFAPTIVFLPHYGGSYASSKRHQEMVGAMGFDSFAFNFSLNNVPLRREQIAQVVREGMIERWTRELEIVLEALEGPKIIYSFSFPSISLPALLAKAPRRDVVGWVCDGGPFTELWGNLWNFYTYQMPVSFKPARFVRTEISHLMIGGFTYPRRMRNWMAAFPASIPVMSVRSGADPLVSEESIDRVFSANLELDPKKLVILGADHLEGLKKNPELYKQHVGEFLRETADKFL